MNHMIMTHIDQQLQAVLVCLPRFPVESTSEESTDIMHTYAAERGFDEMVYMVIMHHHQVHPIEDLQQININKHAG